MKKTSYRERVFSSHRAIETGKAGEHLACADLLLAGYSPILVSDPTSPFDILLPIDGVLLKVQVKSTSKPRFNWGTKKGEMKICTTPSYIFNVNASGYKHQSFYTTKEVDIFALVALDTKLIAYLPYEEKSGNLSFRIPEFRGQYYSEIWQKYNPIIMSMYNDGFTTKEISEKLEMTTYQIYSYKYKKVKSVPGTPNSRYFDEFPFDKCLQQILNKENV